MLLPQLVVTLIAPIDEGVSNASLRGAPRQFRSDAGSVQHGHRDERYGIVRAPDIGADGAECRAVGLRDAV